MTTGKEDSGALSPARIKKTTIGGQALIEGIMMRGPKRIDGGARPKPPDGCRDGTVTCQESQFFRWPFAGVRLWIRCATATGAYALIKIAGLDDAENEKRKENRRDNGLQAAGAVKPAAEKVRKLRQRLFRE